MFRLRWTPDEQGWGSVIVDTSGGRIWLGFAELDSATAQAAAAAGYTDGQMMEMVLDGGLLRRVLTALAVRRQR